MRMQVVRRGSPWSPSRSEDTAPTACRRPPTHIDSGAAPLKKSEQSRLDASAEERRQGRGHAVCHALLSKTRMDQRRPCQNQGSHSLGLFFSPGKRIRLARAN